LEILIIRGKIFDNSMNFSPIFPCIKRFQWGFLAMAMLGELINGIYGIGNCGENISH